MFTSAGYKGTVDAGQFSELLSRAGTSAYGVDGPGDFAVTAVAGQDRVVSVAAGRAWGYSVADVSDVNETRALEAVASGSRWDLVALRRTWTPEGGATTVEVIPGGAAAALPARQHVPGQVDDQPLALVRVDAGSTTIRDILDLRVWARNAGAVAVHGLVREYLNDVGTLLEIAGTWWRRRLGANNVPEWAAVLRSADTDAFAWRSLVMKGTQYLPSSKYTTIYNLEGHNTDPQGVADAVSFYGGVGTIKRAGLWVADGQVTFAGGLEGLRAVSFTVDGKHLHRSFGQGVGQSSLTVRNHWEAWFREGSTIEMQAWQSSGKPMTLPDIADGTRWTLRRVASR